MANKFQIKRTTVAGRTANTTDSANTTFIDKGELAFNLADRRLYSSDSSNTLFEVGANLTTLSVTGGYIGGGSQQQIYLPSANKSVQLAGGAYLLQSSTSAIALPVRQVSSSTVDLFQAQDSAGTAQIVISNTFNFGIGNTTPSHRVSIGGTLYSGNTTVAGDLSVTGNTTLGDAAADSITLNANTITIAANSNIDAGTLYIDSLNNRIGIGTTTPGSSLDVSGGQIRVTSSGTWSEPAINSGILHYDSVNGDFNISARSSGGSTYFRFHTSSSGTGGERMRIAANGNVGIGNTAPANKLSVTGDIGLDGISVRDTATSTTTATTQVTLFEYPVATYDSCDVIIKAVTGGERHTTKLLVTANSTVAIATEYGTLQTGSSLYSVDVDVTSSNTRIRITPASATSTVFKASYELITA